MRKILIGMFLLSGVAVAEESTWYRYSAISPNGETIAFSYAGDLYTVPASGGRATALTHHVAYDFMPVWSWDGKTIAFASERQGNFDVHVLPATGGEAQQLTYYSGADLPAGFSPDGKEILFSSSRGDAVESLQMPNRRMSELYSVPVAGGRVRQILTTPAEGAVYDPEGKRLLYQDRKGGEDPLRKHHTSAVTRDLWMVDLASGAHRQLTDFVGEDRNPVWGKGEEMFYLSEEGGTSNVWTRSLEGKFPARPLTNFAKHPVRFLSRAKNGTLCFGYDGGIYTLAPGGEPVRVGIEMVADPKVNSREHTSTGPVTEVALSPDGKEVAFVARGEVFVTSLEFKETKRVTHTPEQERSVSFHPEGKQLLYASEREGSWNLYTSGIARESEEHFHLATLLEEKAVLTDKEESFQPLFSPDGKAIAYLEERERLVVLDVASGKKRTLLDGSRAYSYRDGDIEFAWSPDGKWLLCTYLPVDRWVEDIVLLAADGSGEVVNMTRNGYMDMNPQWAQNGEVILWMSDRNGMRSHGSWGSEDDVFALFLTEDAHRKFKKTKAEMAQDSDEDKEKDAEKEEGKNDEEKEKKKELPKVEIELKNFEDRVERLTKYSSLLSAAQLSPDGETLYYLSKDGGEQQLWKRNLREDEMKKVASFSKENGRNSQSAMLLAQDGKTLVVLAGGQLYRVGTKDGKKESIDYRATMEIDHVAERAHLFEHIWRQVKKKFYRSDMGGVDWDFYREEYRKHLPQIRHNRDFAELLSEMLGELNASHTGARFLKGSNGAGSTASLGIFHDWNHRGPGIRVLEVMERGPLAQLETTVGLGVIIEKIDGHEIAAGENHYARLWRLSGERVLLSFHDPATDKRWEEVVRPVGLREESSLSYRRWLERMREETDRLSGGKIGYVHIRGMNDGSFREFFGEVFGRHGHKKALVVDTRFNGGGWLTEDLTAFLSGQDYLRFYPREKGRLGGQPIFRWSKPSAVLMSEGNYSDAHMFPFAYKEMGIGKLVGMPVPGTATAVWWERLMDPELLFGIPQVALVGRDGNYLENTQLEPDIRVKNPPEDGPKARDRQLEAAVKHLLALPDPEPWKFPEPGE